MIYFEPHGKYNCLKQRMLWIVAHICFFLYILQEYKPKIRKKTLFSHLSALITVELKIISGRNFLSFFFILPCTDWMIKQDKDCYFSKHESHNLRSKVILRGKVNLRKEVKMKKRLT